jgi:hypothetical protein
MKKLPYREGDLFALPLRDHGYAIGLVARCGPRGRVLFGYFFGRRYTQVPELSHVASFLPKDAILVRRFGDLNLINGEWRVLGQSKDWNRTIWTMPPFVRGDPLTGPKLRVVYSDADPGTSVSQTELPTDADIEPRDIMSGAGAIEIIMTKLLSSAAPA